MTNLPTERDIYGQLLSESLLRVADRHRQIAATLDGLAGQVPLLGSPGNATAIGLAARAVNEIAWISANGNPELVVRTAGDYDRHVPATNPTKEG